MRKLVLKMSMTTNGFVADPSKKLDWMQPTDKGDAKSWQLEKAWDASLHIMGRKTFFDMKSIWPTSNDAYAEPMNEIPKAYFSRSDGSSETERGQTSSNRSTEYSPSGGRGALNSWDEAVRLAGGLEDEIRSLKSKDGKPIIAWGGVGFARGLIPTGLIDEFQFVVHPVVLPDGLGIFSGLTAPLKLNLVDLQKFDNGVEAKTFHLSSG